MSRAPAGLIVTLSLVFAGLACPNAEAATEPAGVPTSIIGDLRDANETFPDTPVGQTSTLPCLGWEALVKALAGHPHTLLATSGCTAPSGSGGVRSAAAMEPAEVTTPRSAAGTSEAGDRTSVPSELVLTAPWGAQDGNIGLRTVPGGSEGAQSLAVDEEHDLIYILDTVNQRILAFSLTGEFRLAVPTGFEAVDLRLDRQGRLVLLASSRRLVGLLDIDDGTMERFEIASDAQRLLRLAVDSKGRVLGETVDGSVRPLRFASSRATATSESTANQTEPDEWPLVHRETAERGIVMFSTEGLPKGRKIAVLPDFGVLDSLAYVGKDDAGDVVVMVDEHGEDLVASRYLNWYRDDRLMAIAEMPTSGFAYTTRDLEVTPSGDVYQLLPVRSGLKVLRWNPADARLSEIGQQFDLQATETQSAPVTRIEPEELGQEPLIGNTLTPVSQAVSTANAYLNHSYYASSQNITSGSVEGTVCPGTKTVGTPISSPGWYTGVPYKWGGASGLASVSAGDGNICSYGFFDAGLQAGRFAGDNLDATSLYCESCSAVGVDCSGFVAQCWGLLGHPFGTGDVTGYACQLNSLSDDLMQGDVVVSTSQGHMRLFDYVDLAGNRHFWESTAIGGAWKVVENPYDVATLQAYGYVPYRYKRIEGIFNTGSRVRAATSGLNVRPCASTSCTPVVGQEALGKLGTIVGGPQEGDGYLWWQVNWDDGIQGWSVQCYFGPASAAVTCTSFSIAPTSVGPSAAAGSQLVTITGSPAGCQGGSWSATGNGSWVTVSPTSGSGSGSTAVYWSQNTSTSSRWGTASVAGNSFAVNQAGSSPPTCTSFSIVPTSVSPSAAAGSQLVTITGSPAGCQGGNWSATGNGSWVTVSPTSGSGSGSTTVYWSQNTSSSSRLDYAAIAGTSFAVTQAGLSTNVIFGDGFENGTWAAWSSVVGPLDCTTYTGLLSTGATDFQPNGTYYYSDVQGTHNGHLVGPTGADFDLYLWQWDGSSWQLVALSASTSNLEDIFYSGTAGYYTWGVYAYGGSGAYSLCIAHP